MEEEQARVRELEDLKRHLDGETEDLQNQVGPFENEENGDPSCRKPLVTGWENGPITSDILFHTP